jgi:phosphohistidine swiveling domain-containing protein
VVQNTVPTTTVTGSVNATCTAVDLDIRNLSSSTDSVNVGTVTTLPAITGSVSVSNMIPAVETGLATSAKQLPDNHQVTVSNIASTPLITGFATSAKQLPDGHNVTVDNAGGAAAVNIQDGGNTITVDGSVTATVSATDLDIRDIDWATDDIKVYAADECQRILTSDDAVTTVNYATSAKASVSNIVTSSAGLSKKVTDTYDNTGETTLVITRVVANV